MGRPSAPPEISLAETCKLLGLSEKTIRQQISLKNIQAVKVGKSWFVDKKSVEEFAAKHAKRAPPLLRSEQGEPEANATLAAPDIAAPARPGIAAIHDLACYRLVVAATEQFKLVAGPAACASYVEQQCREALHQLGAGYYNFGHAKRFHYERARAALGGVIAVLAADAALYQQYERAVLFCERDVLPAFGALMRKLERKGSDPHRQRGGSAQGSDRVP